MATFMEDFSTSPPSSSSSSSPSSPSPTPSPSPTSAHTTSATPLTIVVDTGSWNVRAGLSGPGKMPRVVRADSDDFRWEIVTEGKWRLPIMLACGPDAAKHGLKSGPDRNLEMIWKCIILNVLKASPDQHPVLLVEDPTTTAEERKRSIEIMFEKLLVPGLFIATSPALSMHWTGQSTGVVVDCGHNSTNIVPFYHLQTLQSQAKKLNYGGEDVTKYIKYQLARRRKRRFTLRDNSPSAIEAARVIKHALLYRPRGAHSDRGPVEITPEDDAVWSLNEEKLLRFSPEFFTCTESLFRPFLFGKFVDGLHQEVRNVIESCPEEMWMDLYKNVLLCGSGSMFQSLRDRFLIHISRIETSCAEVNVATPDNREHSAWLGGSKLASSAVFHDELLASRLDYHECGDSVFQRSPRSSMFE
ncbi:actin-like [Corticium candelabrum]|uniref:actin-like n=1 Tax=Corticium candelabrum TaxID=121492 RepID=UPI002E264F2E|nr:actin-like [Corticium candelabrum]